MKMKENLKNLKLINKKGGCMLRKVLSVLLICCFMFTNVCFAMPTAAGIKATVDNMALKSFLQTGDPTVIGDRAAFTAAINSILEKKGTTIKEEIIDMWAKNDTVEARVAAAQKSGIPGITLIEVAGKMIVDIDVKEFGLSSKAETQENVAALENAANQAIADGKTTPVTATQKAQDRVNLKAMLDAGNITEARKQEVLNAFDARGLHTMAPIVIDANNRLHGLSKADASYIDENLTGTARTDMILHETLESLNNNNDEAVMAEQMAIHGLDNVSRKAPDSVMETTRQAMYDSAQTVIAAQEEKAPADAITVNKSFLSKDSNDVAVQAEARAMLVKAMSGKESEISKADPKTLVTMVQGLIQTKINEITASLQTAIGAFIPVSKNVATTEVQAEAAQKIAAGLKDGEVLAMDYDMLFTTQNGKVIPRAGALVLLDALNNSKVKDGAIQIISATNVAGAQDALDYLFPGIGAKITINAGNESKLDVVNVNPSLLRVLYSNEASIEGNIADVSYIKAPQLDKVNGLQVLIAALASNLKSLTVSEQAILSDLGNGKFELQNVGIDDAAYATMQREYKIVVDILIQA